MIDRGVQQHLGAVGHAQGRLRDRRRLRSSHRIW